MMGLSLALGAMVSQLRAVMFYITLVLETEAGSGTADKEPQTRPKSLQVAVGEGFSNVRTL